MLNLEKFLKECEENPVSLALQKTTSLGNNAYKVLCEVSRLDYKPHDLKKAVAKLFKNKVSLVDSTVVLKQGNLLSMVVKANLRSMAFDENNIPAGKKKITAGVYADVDDNSIWEVVSNGKEKRLVLKKDQSFDKIFEHDNRICTATAMDKPVAVNSGDYVSYYSPKDSKVKAGYILVSEDDEMVVIDKEGCENEVQPEEVIQSADLTSMDKNPVQAAVSANELNKIKDYIAQMFKDTEFFKTLDEMLGADGDLEDKYPNTTMASTNLEDIKAEIKDFLINDSIKELREELLNADKEEVTSEEEEEIVEEADGNADGDLDFATEEEIDTFEEAPEVEETLEEKVEESDAEEPVEEIECDMPDIENVSLEDDEADEEVSDLLDADEVGITTEAELDDGEFEEVEVKEPSEDQIQEKLKEIFSK